MQTTHPSGQLSIEALEAAAQARSPEPGPRNNLRRTHRTGLVIVVLLLLAALMAPVVSPHDPAEQLDPRVGARRPPLTRLIAVEVEQDGRRQTLLADRVKERGADLVLDRRGAETVVAAANSELRGTRVYALGTDRLGRDILSRILWGSRVSLAVGILAALLAVTLGTLLGATAALSGGWVDNLIMRTVDGILALPTTLLILVIAMVFEPNLWLLVLLLGGLGWMTLSRLVRSEILSLKEREFVLASRSVGVRAPSLLLKHLLPNAFGPIAVTGSLLVGDAILVEATLSFLGLGVHSESASWGQMIANGRDDLRTLWWISTFPGVAIALTVLSFALLGDGLRDLLDPRTGARAGRSAS